MKFAGDSPVGQGDIVEPVYQPGNFFIIKARR